MKDPDPRIIARYAAAARAGSGFTLVELMVAMTISLLVLLALVNVFGNASRSITDMTNTHALIENGRLVTQLLEDDVVHAGFWGGYIPQFDDLSSDAVPGDAPTAVPDPCLAYAAWDSTYKSNLLGIAVQAYEVLPTGTGCLTPLAQRPGTDVLVIRHADTCVPGTGNCDPDVAGRIYLQSSFCAAEKNAGVVQVATNNSLTLSPNASADNDAYRGLTLRTVSGVGAGQYRAISNYNGTTRVATVMPDWTTIPDNTTTYSFEYVLGTSAFPLHKRDCVGTGSPASLPITGGTFADKRRLVSSIYYISNIAHPERPDEVVPTLVRSQLDFAGGVIAHQPPMALIEGIEAFRVELGIDDIGETGAAPDYAQAIAWADPNNKASALNRGDGAPDTFIRCTAATPCSPAQLTNVVAIKIYVLARSRDTSPGYTNAKTYCLGEPNADGSCPPANEIAAPGDQYKRHLFTTSVRLTNVSGRRETPL